MASKIQAGSLSDLQVPVLTAYINTNPAKSGSRGPVPAYVAWFKRESKSLVSSVLPTEQKIFRDQVDRIGEFLRNRKPQEQSLLILSGQGRWEVIPLQLEVDNEIHWGRPALAQLFSLQITHRPGCIVVVDRTRARFLRYGLGEWTELGEMKFGFDVAQWKRKDIGHLAHPGIKTTRGTQRDTFEHRVDAQYARLCPQAAKQVEKLCRKNRLDAIFLVGLPRLVEPIESHLPVAFRNRTVLVKEYLGKLTLPQLKSRLAKVISDCETPHGARDSVRPGKQVSLSA